MIIQPYWTMLKFKPLLLLDFVNTSVLIGSSVKDLVEVLYSLYHSTHAINNM